MATDVLKFFRQRDKRFEEVPDAELISFIGEKYPKFRQDPEFEREYINQNPPAQLQPRLAGEGPDAALDGLMSEALKTDSTLAKWDAAVKGDKPDPEKVKQQMFARTQAFDEITNQAAAMRELAGDDPLKRELANEWQRKQLEEIGIGTIGPMKGPVQAVGETVGPAMDRAGKVSKAFVADLATLYPDGIPPSLENLAAFASNPDDPLPVDRAVNDPDLGFWPRVAGKAASAAAHMAPVIGTAAGLGAVGVPPQVANIGVLGFDAEGKIDPLGVAIAAGLPFVDAAGRSIVSEQILKRLKKTTFVLEELPSGKLLPKIENRFPMLERNAVQKALEVGGGQLANNAYLMTLQAPGILEAKDWQGAFEDAFINNLVISLMGAPEVFRGGKSLTSQTARQMGGVNPRFEIRKLLTDTPRIGSGGEAGPRRRAARPAEPPPSEPRVFHLPPPGGQTKPAAKGGGDIGGAMPPVKPPPSTPAATPPPEPTPKPTAQTPQPPAAPRGKAPVDLSKLGISLTPPQSGMFTGGSKPTNVSGTKGMKLAAVYAWMMPEDIAASHIKAETPDPRYAPLRNTRDYERDLAEREKVLEGARNFDPESYVNNSRSASVGPIMVSRGSDGQYRVLGGNGRLQMIQSLTPEQRQALYHESSLATIDDPNPYGLQPPSWQLSNEDVAAGKLPILVRVLPDHDISSTEGVDKANQVIDILNPSEGLREPVEQSARNDALHVPAEALQQISVQSGTGLKRDFVQHLIGIGAIDRNSRQHILASESQTHAYVNTLLFQVAYGDDFLARYHADPKRSATAKGIVEQVADTLIVFRRKGGNADLAGGFTEVFRRVAEMEAKFKDKPLDQILKLVGSQGELTEPMPVKLGRQLATVLAGEFEVSTDKNGKRKIDSGATLANIEGLLTRLRDVVKQNEANGTEDIFGNQRTSAEVVSDWLRLRLGDDQSGGVADRLAEPQGAFGEGSPGSTWSERPIGNLMVGDLVKVEGRDLVFRGWQGDELADGTREAVFYDQESKGTPIVIPMLPSQRVESFSADNPSYSQSEALIEWRKLMRRKDRLEQAGKSLSQDEVRRLEILEKALGQEFMGFYESQKASEEAASEAAKRRRMEIEALQKKRLVGGQIETQQSLLPPGNDATEPGGDDAQLSFLAPQRPFNAQPVSELSERMTQAGTLAAKIMLEAYEKGGVEAYAKVGRQAQSELARLVERADLDDIVDAINRLGISSPGAAIIARAYESQRGAVNVMLEFETGGILSTSIGDALAQRKSKPSFGRLVGIETFPGYATGLQSAIFVASDNPIFIKQATRNELKLMVGSKAVNDAMFYKQGRFREIYSGVAAGRVSEGEAVDYAKIRGKIEKDLGMSLDEFWRTARGGNASLVNRLVDEYPNRKREQIRARGGSVGPIDLTRMTQPLQGGESGQMTLMENRNEFGDPSLMLPGMDNILLKPKPQVKGDEPVENPKLEGPRAKARRAGQQLQLGGVGPAEQQRKRPGSGTVKREVITARPQFLPQLYGSTYRYTQQFPNLVYRLREHQHDGVNRIIHAWNQGKDFGLFDGTGAGKTMQELAAAQLASRKFSGPVLIVTERQAIIDDAFAKDAEFLEIDVYQYKGAPIEPDKIYIATYTDLTLGKIPSGQFTTVIWDEAHNLRGIDKSQKSAEGLKLANEAVRNLFATATPLDRPEQLWYLQSLLDVGPEVALARIGIKTTWVKTRNGIERPRFEIEREITEGEIVDLLEGLFDDIYKRGQAIKREVPLDNIEVGLKAVRVSEDDYRDINDKMSLLKRLYARRKVPGHLIQGIVLQAGRAELERYKVEATLEMVDRSIQEGRQAIVFAYRIEPGQAQGVGGAIGILMHRLKEKYGQDSVGVLYGGASTLKARRYQEQMLRRFSDGALKIIVGTPASGGTGINLDDIHGDAPRDLILMTAPFSALEMVQIAGRINRLTTRSKGRMFVLLSQHGVDRWNLGISLAKMGRLGAAVKGDIENLKPTNFLHAIEQPFGNNARLGQMDFPWEVEKLQSVSGDLGREALRLAAWTFHGEVVAAVEKGVPLVGRKASSLEEVAALAQATRNPAYEIHWMIYTKGGQVVGSRAVTARLPHETPAVLPGETLDTVLAEAGQLEADGVYAWHNHPTGDVAPSYADTKAVANMKDHLGGILKGYFVINDTQYAHWTWPEVVEPGMAETSARMAVGNVPPEAVRQIKGFHGDPGLQVLLQTELRNTRAVVNAAQLVSKSPGVVSFIFQSSDLAVTAIAQASALDITRDPAAFAAHLREVGRRNGARRAFAIAGGSYMADDLAAALLNLYESGTVRDVVVDQTSWAEQSYDFAPRVAEGWFGMDAGEADVYRLQAKEREFGMDQMETPALYYSTSGYNPNAPTMKGSVVVRMGGMQHVRPVEMPELVNLAKELMGQRPWIKKNKTFKWRGLFKPGGSGAIVLDARIFSDQIAAAKTLAHEIGHLIDYLPDQSLKRGNILGRLFTLRNFISGTFGPRQIKNKDIRAELAALSHYWKPIPPFASAGFIAYRMSSVELYADALSVLLNSPGLLEQMAPQFYNVFWQELDRKPDVKRALYDLQDFLGRGKLNTLQQRHNATMADFRSGDAIMRKKFDDREARRKSWKGWHVEVMQHYLDRFYPAQRLQRKAEKGGAVFAPNKDPRQILDEFGLRDTHNFRLVRSIHENVIAPLEAEGFTLDDLGEYMMMERIAYGDRQAFGNPNGHTPLTARMQISHMRQRFGGGAKGLEAITALDRFASAFRSTIYPLTEEAVKVGAYNKTTHRKQIAPNRKTYAAFGVLDYLQDYVPAKVHQQIGTFAGVANPVMTTVLKAIAINNLIALQKAKNTVVDDLLRKHFATEIEPAKSKGFGPGKQWQPPPPEKGVLTRLENGVRHDYYVDPYIARMFEDLYPGQVATAVRFLDRMFRTTFYPLFITYNPGFMLFLSPGRDFQRTARNLRSVGVTFAHTRLAYNMVKQFMAARRRLKGETGGARPSDQVVREAEANLAFSMPWDSFATQHRDDHLGRLLRRYGLAPNEEAKGIIGKLGSKVRRPLDWIEFYGMVLDNLPKQASYRILTKGMHMAPREAAGIVRNYVGLPNIHKKGTEAKFARSIIPFLNVFAQSWRADAKLMRSPKTRLAWWMHWVLKDGFLSAIKGLAAAGFFGVALKALFDGVSEYDKTNYHVIPLGHELGGDFGRKTRYLRIPMDETSRFLSGVTYKLFSSLGPNDPVDSGFADVLDFGADQVPGINPVIDVAAGWGQFMVGENPYDPFWGRPVVPTTEFKAGGWPAVKEMLAWTLDTSGAMNIVRWDSEAETTLGLVTSAIPGINRVIKSSDYGYRERQLYEVEKIEAEHARLKLELSDNVRGAIGEYFVLRNIGEQRTATQEGRYHELNQWYYQVYRPVMEKLDTLSQNNLLTDENKRNLITTLKGVTEPFKPTRQ